MGIGGIQKAMLCNFCAARLCIFGKNIMNQRAEKSANPDNGFTLFYLKAFD